jgi:hypothetical protein
VSTGSQPRAGDVMDDASRKGGALNAVISAETLVEGDDFKIGGPGKCGQESVVPDLRSERPRLGVIAPYGLESDRLAREGNAVVAKNCVVEPPRCRRGYRIRAKHPGVGGKSEKALLRRPAEKEQSARHVLEPALGCCVMDMGCEGQCNPDVDVKQKHRRLPTALRFGRWSIRAFRADSTEQAGIVPSLTNQVAELRVRRDKALTPPHLPVAPSRRPRAQRRYALDLGLPCRHPSRSFAQKLVKACAFRLAGERSGARAIAPALCLRGIVLDRTMTRHGRNSLSDSAKSNPTGPKRISAGQLSGVPALGAVLPTSPTPMTAGRPRLDRCAQKPVATNYRRSTPTTGN